MRPSAGSLRAWTTRFYEKVPHDPCMGAGIAGMDPHLATMLQPSSPNVRRAESYSGNGGSHPYDRSASRRQLTEEFTQALAFEMLDTADEVGLPTLPNFERPLSVSRMGTRLPC